MTPVRFARCLPFILSLLLVLGAVRAHGEAARNSLCCSTKNEPGFYEVHRFEFGRKIYFTGFDDTSEPGCGSACSFTAIHICSLDTCKFSDADMLIGDVSGPLPEGLFFLDERNGWVWYKWNGESGKEEGAIYFTASGTRKWIKRASIVVDDLFFIEAKRGWAVTRYDDFFSSIWAGETRILETQDGGKTWKPVTPEKAVSYYGLSKDKYDQLFKWPTGRDYRDMLVMQKANEAAKK